MRDSEVDVVGNLDATKKIELKTHKTTNKIKTIIRV
jgi:hypothetical protein